jgi:hypothetical protein
MPLVQCTHGDALNHEYGEAGSAAIAGYFDILPLAAKKPLGAGKEKKHGTNTTRK